MMHVRRYKIRYLLDIFIHKKLIHTSIPCMKKRQTKEERKMPKMIVYTPKSKFKETSVIEVWRNMTLKELGDQLNKNVDHVLEVMSFIDNTIHYRKPDQIIDDFKIIEEIVKKSGKRYKMINKKTNDDDKFQDIERRTEYFNVKPRPPVVTIMGHVDHGKTTLLDKLRNSRIVDDEFGGITQHIGAFSVQVNNKKVTFLDTPGHAAFISMRNRGAQCTDIIILVIAGDDGVMEQTIESINMAKESKVPIIIAINKIDKPKCDIERTKKMLIKHDIQVEDYGGDVQVVPISALNGTNIDLLMDCVLLQAELLDLKSDYSGPVEATVIESTNDTYRGKLATLLIQLGTLRKGSILIAGTTWCKVRAMFDNNSPISEATPSTPVQILGWKDLPSPGDICIQVQTEKKASIITDKRKELKLLDKSEKDLEIIQQKQKEHYIKYREMLEHKRNLGRFKLRPTGPRQKLYTNDEDLKLNIIIKADVDGSMEAILDVLDTYENNDCKLNLVHYGIGPVSPNDVVLAESFNAIIYTFNTRLLDNANYSKIKHHNVIYKLIQDIKLDINSILPFKEEEEIIGEATVLQEFIINENKSKIPVAGCRCNKGIIKKTLAKVVRNNEIIYSGEIISLKHLKNEVESIKKELECGIRIGDETVHFKPGDSIICYKINKVPQVVDWDPGF